MSGCNRGELDEPVNVPAIERAVAELAAWPDPHNHFAPRRSPS